MEVPRDRLDLRDDKGVLSPPILSQPLYGCAKSVNITGYVPDAMLDVEVNGSIVVAAFPGNSPAPNGATIQLPAPLAPGQTVRARQHHNGATSGWSAPALVRDHTVDYPAGPPRPEIFPTPLYRCGVRTGVGNLLVGCDVRVTENGANVGGVAGANNPQGVNVSPAFDTGQHVRAFASLCNDPSPPSVEQIVQPPPLPLPTPGFDLAYAGSTVLVVNTIVDGAEFTLSRNGLLVGTFACWGGKCEIQLSPPFSAGDKFEAMQQLCAADGPSAVGTGTVLPCSALPAPQVAPVQDGDTQVIVTQFVAGSEIKVFVNSVKTGDGSGPVVALTTPVPHGATVDVWQIAGSCEGSTVQQVTTQCVAPPTTYDPAGLDLFPVGTHEWDFGTVPVPGFGNVPISGSVSYPAEDDGAEQPFNKRLAGLGERPVVILVHGNHDPGVPSYRGYDYFQQQLAQMGFVAFSLNHNHANGPTGGPTNIVLRAEMAIAAIAKLQQLNVADPLFKGTLDFSRLGLMGHSRGGETVVVIPERIALPGVSIHAVLALAPTDNGASSGIPGNYTFMTILPAADGDVSTNDGARFYDQAAPHPLKSQVYVDYANHNFFNRQWGDDPEVITPHLHRADQERMLSAYGCALFRTALAGDDQSGFLRGLELPAGVLTNNVHLAFDVDTRLVVDNFDGHPVSVNSVGGPNTQSGGFLGKTFPFGQGAGAFNGSFFGNTSGMVGTTTEATGVFRLGLEKTITLQDHDVWLRTAEVWQGSQAPNAVDFRVGVEDAGGTVGWVDVNGVGGVARPFDRSAFDGLTKTMLSTMRFHGSCFADNQTKLRLSDIRAILVALETPRGIAVAFDDIGVVPSA